MNQVFYSRIPLSLSPPGWEISTCHWPNAGKFMKINLINPQATGAGKNLNRKIRDREHSVDREHSDELHNWSIGGSNVPVLLLVCHVFQFQNLKLEAIKDDEASTCHKEVICIQRQSALEKTAAVSLLSSVKTAQHEKLNVLFRCPHHRQKRETLLQLGVALQVSIAFTL